VLCTGAEAKASLQGRMKYVAVDPKPKRSTHGQDEARVMPSGGPNPLLLKKFGMNCG
jgi:hypothetical protein